LRHCSLEPARVSAINTDEPTYPENIQFACQWNVSPEVIVDDFQVHQFDCGYDVIFFLGVLYHQENIFEAPARIVKRWRHTVPGNSDVVD